MPRKARANYFNFSGGYDTDSSPLNRSPVTVTSIDNCTLNLDGSIESRKGLSITGVSMITTTAEPNPTTGRQIDFVDSAGNLQQHQIIHSRGLIRYFSGDASIFESSTGTTLATTGESSLFNGLKDIQFDGKYLFYGKGGTTATYVGYAIFTPPSTWGNPSSFFPSQKRNIVTLGASKEPDSAWQAGATVLDVHPFQPSQTAWTSGAYTGVPDYSDTTSYSSGNQVKVERGVVRITDYSDVGAGQKLSTIRIGAPVRINKPTGAVYDRVREVEDKTTYYRIILENLSDTEGVDSVSFTEVINLDDSGAPYIVKPINGRIFMVCEDIPWRVYFSQVYTEDLLNIKRCHTAADPFDPVDNAVVASDGGYFDVTEVGIINAIEEMNGSIYITSDNGVWEVVGSDGIFRADDYVVRQVTSKGNVGRFSITSMEDSIAYVSKDGINVISKDAQSGILSVVNSLTDNKIQSYITSLPKQCLQGARLRYNNVKKELYVLHNTVNPPGASRLDEGVSSLFRNILIYNVRLNAWYLYSLSSDTNYVKLGIQDIYMATDDEEDIPICIYSIFPASPSTSQQTTFGKLYSTDEKDFDGTDYEEYNTANFTSAHQTYGDLMRGKINNYIKVLYEGIETDTTDDHGWSIPLGGCKLRAAIDFANDPVQITDGFGQTKDTNVSYGREFEIYPTETTGFSHHTYKHKLLGRGNVLQYTFSNELKERWYKCISASTGDSPILDDGTYWEECTEADYTSGSGAEWAVGTAYVEDDYVKVTKLTHFKIIGWAAEMIPTEGLQTK